jgi:hypothetical protein
MSDTPTREQVQQALHAIDDEGSDFVVRPIRWPWNHLIAAARLWLERTEPTPDEDVDEAPYEARRNRKPLP